MGINVINVVMLGFKKASVYIALLSLIEGICHRNTTWTLGLFMAVVSISTATSLTFLIVHSASDAGCSKGAGTWQTLLYPLMGLVDIALAMIPISIIHGLDIKKGLKQSTCAILALGGVACIASVLFIPPQVGVGGSYYRDYLYNQGSALFWENIETGLGEIVAVLPVLHWILQSFGDDDDGEKAPGDLLYYHKTG